MLNWLFGSKHKQLEDETKKGFSSVKQDMEAIGEWIKHLDKQDKHLMGLVSDLRHDLSSIREGLQGLRETREMDLEILKNQQVFKKLPVVGKQTAVYGVQNAVQTPVQAGNFYEILRNLSSNERLIVFTLMNSDLKMSYEDLAMLLGKEKVTIRGQINAIKQKSEGLIEEISERNGKKRVFVPVEIKDKLAKYAKVRAGRAEKAEVSESREEKTKNEDIL